MPKEQWYVDCKKMAADAMEVVKSGQLSLVPSRHNDVWYDWLGDIRDWCISRQLWWGHRIPVYKIRDAHGNDIELEGEKEVWVSGRNEQEALQKACEKTGLSTDSIYIKQDDDVLDTWFSSALFPFSIFGWPSSTSDLQRFYPTSLLETGSDILFFWVARMVMLGFKLTGELPFSQVLLHGLLRDAHGRKMSKSLGNVIDPIDVINGATKKKLLEQLYRSNLSADEIAKAKVGQQRDFPEGIPESGADALRFTLLSYNYKSDFINMNLQHVKRNRNFCNKVWQAFRFYLKHAGADYKPVTVNKIRGTLRPIDFWILSRLANMVESCDQYFQSYDLHLATQAVQTFWHHELCDVYLECIKPTLLSNDQQENLAAHSTLHTCLDDGLRALSPFMPYLTEELYQRLPEVEGQKSSSVCVAEYPSPNKHDWKNLSLEEDVAILREVVSSALKIRKDFNIKAKTEVYLTGNKTVLTRLSAFKTEMETLSKSSSIIFHQEVPQACCFKAKVNEEVTLYMNVKDWLQPDEFIEKTFGKMKKLENEIKRLTADLESSGYQNKYADHEQILHKEKLLDLNNDLTRCRELVKTVEDMKLDQS